MKIQPQLSRLGDRGLLLKWDFEISPKNLKFLLWQREQIQKFFGDRVEVTNTYDSLLVRYANLDNNLEKDLHQLEHWDFENMGHALPQTEVERSIIEVPVCYDKEFGLDLEVLAKAEKRSTAELIKLHTHPVYTVYFIGFLPGFPYLGGMDPQLAHPRKKQPRRSVQRGAVGIAGDQTGIYPAESPAGWQIIGNCPLLLFDPSRKPPSMFKPGDQISFKQVDRQTYDAIKQAVARGNYEPKKTEPHG